MIDVKEAMSGVEHSLGRKMTEQEKNVAEMLGSFMNSLWEKDKTTDFDPHKTAVGARIEAGLWD